MNAPTSASPDTTSVYAYQPQSPSVANTLANIAAMSGDRMRQVMGECPLCGKETGGHKYCERCGNGY